ncbi:hypothetical protein AK812_SmicGene31596 [Symbiodinium microadriaticum]|uniref:Uncharacterized protein n=1 Tax=Symbiodinium microadriaticum TaxID=2951 RepID=A0A1Q9CWA4_SYMMI|nr:hypothetical protein AK812_SmicGene31596 [Symbiodinium microadriaticum]
MGFQSTRRCHEGEGMAQGNPENARFQRWGSAILSGEVTLSDPEDISGRASQARRYLKELAAASLQPELPAHNTVAWP